MTDSSTPLKYPVFDTPAQRGSHKVDPRRVFLYGQKPHGEYGWIVQENHNHPNPYYVITDSSNIGIWVKTEHFRYVDERQS